MSRICQLTGKKPITGNNRGRKSLTITKRWFIPNLQTKRFYIPEEDRWVTLKVSAKALRTINKLGISKYIKKLKSKGFKISV